MPTTTTTINLLTCAECGLTFGVTKDFQRRRQDDHQTFFCPSGHHNYYPQDNELEAAKKELVRLQNHLRNAEIATTAARDQAQAAERSRAAVKGVLTKTKKRIHNGVCPHCNRHFENVQRHMQSQHKKQLEE